MARTFGWMTLVLLALVSTVGSAPVAGPHTLFKFRVAAGGEADFTEEFQAGRRACVIAVGDHNPPVELGVTVYDEANNLLAQDKGLDFAAAMWYPPREAKYNIVLKNFGVEFNDMYLVFK